MRYLKIKTLPTAKQWIDRDVIMLHACFQILQDAVEQEQVDTQCDYDAHKDVVDEIRYLYNWWVKRPVDFDDDEEDTQMLQRLMRIRNFLWT